MNKINIIGMWMIAGPIFAIAVVGFAMWLHDIYRELGPKWFSTIALITLWVVAAAVMASWNPA